MLLCYMQTEGSGSLQLCTQAEDSLHWAWHDMQQKHQAEKCLTLP